MCDTNETDGRHPLAELAVDTFIPNDTYLHGLAVITGPNFSGKSVYVKQVAVLVYLAMLGYAYALNRRVT